MQRRLRRGESGQSSTEYMLAISVVVIAVVGAAYVFVPRFRRGVDSLAKDTSSILATGAVGSIGESRDGNGGNGANAGSRSIRGPIITDPP